MIRLHNGERIWRGTAQGNYAEFVMQSDGNLVLDSYGRDGRRVCWAAKIHGQGGRYVEYQHDGNLVVYTVDNRPVWASNTQGSPGDNTNITRFGQVYVGYNALTEYCL
ncbi:hypothetical protein [Streptomyces lavendofoliae]|uniref:hypothetical protein n=1 Tax=Streptomyces lavendofoliae TaxID=67314 RepID=UPI00300EDA1A